MSKGDATLGNFHKPTTGQHPPESIGNQPIYNDGRQVGSLEFVPQKNGTLGIQVNNTSGQEVFNISK